MVEFFAECFDQQLDDFNSNKLLPESLVEDAAKELPQ
jgi:hypothetical protein